MNGILALDLATATGWAHSDGASGVADFSLKRGDSPGMRFVRCRVFLDRALEAAPFELVAYEQPHHRGGHATAVLVGLVGTVQCWCAEKGIEHLAKTTSDIKIHATGKGRASKLAMTLAAEKRFGFEPIDDNHADALWLLDLVKKELEGCPID